jgi:DNA ligase D-like protein (predicted 3'-phosphoesterase)
MRHSHEGSSRRPLFLSPSRNARVGGPGKREGPGLPSPRAGRARTTIRPIRPDVRGADSDEIACRAPETFPVPGKLPTMTLNRTAVRAVIRGDVQGVGFREATVARARELGIKGWVRYGEDGALALHAEGKPRQLRQLVAFLNAGPPGARVAAVDTEDVRAEGHEQFAIRGVSSGIFVVQEHSATAHHYDLRLEVDGVMRSWTVPKGPSLDPAVKRLAVQAADHDKTDNDFEGKFGDGGVIAWDRGTYEQGGRVAWPQAIDRGHAVFVLHGEKLLGGFALQRTRSGEKAQWLLIKRRDEGARPGSDIVAERPESVASGRTLDDLLT